MAREPLGTSPCMFYRLTGYSHPPLSHHQQRLEPRNRIRPPRLALALLRLALRSLRPLGRIRTLGPVFVGGALSPLVIGGGGGEGESEGRDASAASPLSVSPPAAPGRASQTPSASRPHHPPPRRCSGGRPPGIPSGSGTTWGGRSRDGGGGHGNSRGKAGGKWGPARPTKEQQ